MRRVRQNSWFRSFLLPFATVLWLGTASCTSWKTVKPPVESTLESERPEKVRVTMADGSEFEVISPRIVADSLIGVERSADGNPRFANSTVDVSIAVPLADVQSVEMQQTDAAGAAAIVFGLAALGALFVVLLNAMVEDSWESS